MRIEKINKEDIQVIINLLKNLYLELGEEKESIKFLNEELITELIDNGNTTILKATDNDEIVGLITLTESQAIYSGGKFGSIDEMYVEQKYRNQNVGEHLIKKAVKIGEEKEWKRIDVTAPTNNNALALNFYKKNSFIFTGPKLKLKIK
jgi:ribosomal protein S18 acetylase RimI-like enzyme